MKPQILRLFRADYGSAMYHLKAIRAGFVIKSMCDRGFEDLFGEVIPPGTSTLVRVHFDIGHEFISRLKFVRTNTASDKLYYVYDTLTGEYLTLIQSYHIRNYCGAKLTEKVYFADITFEIVPGEEVEYALSGKARP